MIRCYVPIILTGCLTLLAVCTTGIALSYTAMVRSSYFDITVDDDSLRTTALIETLENLHNLSRFNLPVSRIASNLASIRQVDNVIVKRHLSGLIRIHISTRKPVVQICNTQTAISLSPDGTPFPYSPEHGQLPSFRVSNDLTQNLMLNPDSKLQTVYGVAIQFAASQVSYLRNYSNVVHVTESYVDLSCADSNNRLRLPGKMNSDSAFTIEQIDQWLMSHWKNPGTFEYDARFMGILIIRPIQEDVNRG
jgi:hypothetical protein